MFGIQIVVNIFWFCITENKSDIEKLLWESLTLIKFSMFHISSVI